MKKILLGLSLLFTVSTFANTEGCYIASMEMQSKYMLNSYVEGNKTMPLSMKVSELSSEEALTFEPFLSLIDKIRENCPMDKEFLKHALGFLEVHASVDGGHRFGIGRIDTSGKIWKQAVLNLNTLELEIKEL